MGQGRTSSTSFEIPCPCLARSITRIPGSPPGLDRYALVGNPRNREQAVVYTSPSFLKSVASIDDTSMTTMREYYDQSVE
eukprot:2322345-Rhodomonas_salina.5